MAKAINPAKALMDDALFAETFLKVLDRDKRLVPLKLNRAQRHYLKHRTKRDIILKARQLGFSTLIQAVWFRAAITSTSTTMTMAHLDSTTQSLRRMVNRFYDRMPADFRPQRKLANDTLSTYPDFDSEAVIATAGSPQVGRGLTTSHIHASEVALYRDAESLMAGVMQSLTPSGMIVLESTANGAQGWFYERCQEALSGRGVWKIHFYPWWWADEYMRPIDGPLDLDSEEHALKAKHNLTDTQIAWRREKIAEIGYRLFQQEFPESPETAFLTSAESVFGSVRHALAPDDCQPDARERYVGGVDWGQQDDYTVLSVMASEANREVALYRWRKMSWVDMRAGIVEACKRWRVEKLIVEKNSASSNVEALIMELQAAGLDVTVEPRTMTAPLKAQIVTTMYNGLHRDGLRLLDVDDATRELMAYTSKQGANGMWSYSHPEGGHDDTVDARMWAYYGLTRMVR